jgi:CrcB protein
VPSKRTPVTPDVDAAAPSQRRTSRDGQGTLLAVIAAGGAAGACARYGLALWMPHAAGSFPWATFLANISGCLLVGVLMVLVTEVWSAHRLLRPFLGVGILGGYTTFSTYTGEARALLDGGHGRLGFSYLALTIAGAMLGVSAGVFLTRLAARSRPSADRRRP